MERANDLLQNAYYQQAIQEYDKILKSNPDRDIILAANYNKAQAYDGLGQYSAASACYEKVITMDPKFQNGEVYYEHGQVLQLGKMYSQSKGAYLKYLNFQPKNAQCYFNLGQVLNSLGQLQQAIKAYEKAVEFKPSYTKAYQYKITILKRLKRHDQILKVCSKALSVEPTDFDILYEEGFAFNNLQRYRQSTESLNDCIKYNKKCVRAYIALADCYYKSQKDQLGLETLNKCFEINSDVMKTVEKKQMKILMGTIYMNSKQYKNAIECFKEVLSQKPIIEHVKGKVAACLEEYGNVFFSEQSFKDALVCYTEALKYDNRLSSINNSGLCYLSMERFQEAEKCFNQVLSKDASNINALNNLASLYIKTGNNKKAEEIFNNLALRNTSNPEVFINNGKNYLILHKYKEAYSEFSKALQMNTDQSNYNLMNDLSVTLQRLHRYEQALSFADKANDLTNNKSPLFLLNRASILMNLQKISLAKLDFDRAAAELRVPDKEFLQKLGINVGNLKYIFNQLNHYAYLMQPINDLRKQLERQAQEMPIRDEVRFNKVVEKVEKAEGYAMSRIITQINKQNPQQIPNPQESRQDYNTILKFMQEAKQIMQSQRRQIQMLKSQVNLLKQDSQEIKQKLKYLPQSANLKKKLDQLYAEQDVEIWLYGKQLYWILNGYFKGYMLIATGVVSKGENIDRGKFNQAMKSVGGILQYANNIPLIGQFSELISKICGFFVDKEDEVIIEKMYEVISYNYDLEEDLNNEICQAVLTILNSPYKISKIRDNLSFNPSKSFFSKIEEKMEDISDWFSQKKNEFIMHLRGYEKLSKIAQHQLALVDAGAMISIILNTSSIPTGKLRPIFNAAKNIGYGDELQEMIYEAYKRENEEIRMSNHSYCVIMRCQLIYDNPALNSRKFLEYLRGQKCYHLLMSKTVSLSPVYFGLIEDLLLCGQYQTSMDIICSRAF